MGIQLYANIDATSLATARVQSANDLRPKAVKPLAAGDSTVVDVFLTGQNGLQNIQDFPTRRLGIGSINARPTGGTFDYGAQTGLDYNISASALQTAIATETAACTVTQVTNFVYKVVFSANGAQTIATVDSSALEPSSTVSIKRLVTGDASTQEKWLIRIYQNPVAIIDSNWTNITGDGIRGSLNLGTEGIYRLLGTENSASTFLELELTDSSGDIQTIFQIPVTISGEVVGEGVIGVATFDSYVTSSSLKGLPGLAPTDEAVIRGNGTSWQLASSLRADTGSVYSNGVEMGTGTATGERSVAEGESTTASGFAAHAEGNNTTASGFAAHAEGSYTEASAGNSSATGRRARAIHEGARVEADNVNADVSSTTTNQFTARFQNGYEFKGGAANFEDAAGTRENLGAAPVGVNYVAVKSLSDLPDPVSGTITLAASTTYELDGIIEIETNTLNCSNDTSIVGRSPALDGVLYTGSANAIEASDKTVYLRQISVVGATGGVGIDFSDTVGRFLNVINCAFIGLTTGANVSGGGVISFQNTLFRECYNGLVKEATTDSIQKIVTNSCFFDDTPNDATGVGIKIQNTSTVSELDILSCKFVANLGTCIDIASADTISNTATLLNNRFLGTATNLTGVDFSSERFNLVLNDGIEDSRINGQYGFTGNTTATTITTQDAWVKIGITTTASLLSGFTHTSPNELTYARRRDRVCQVGVSGSISSTANNVEAEIGIFINGTLDISTPITLRAASVKGPFSTSFQVQLSENDEIDVRIRNTGGTEDLTVAALQVATHAVN